MARMMRAASVFAVSSSLEPVFTAEDAVWPRDFSVRQGEFSPEYFVYCKKIQRGLAEKDPARRRLRL